MQSPGREGRNHPPPGQRRTWSSRLGRPRARGRRAAPWSPASGPEAAAMIFHDANRSAERGRGGTRLGALDIISCLAGKLEASPLLPGLVLGTVPVSCEWGQTPGTGSGSGMNWGQSRGDVEQGAGGWGPPVPSAGS